MDEASLIGNPPHLYFFTTPQAGKYEKIYGPPNEEQRIIINFLREGYNPNVNSVKKPAKEEINELEGLFWVLGSDSLELTSSYKEDEYKGDEIFFLVYWNDDISPEEFEAAENHFAEMLGLSSFKRKGQKKFDFGPVGQPCLLSPEYPKGEKLPDGRTVTRIKGGDTERVQRCIDEAQRWLHVLEKVDDEVPTRRMLL